LTWDHGKDKEHVRLNSLKQLYDGIILNSKAIFGSNQSQEEIYKKLNAIDLL